MVALNDIFDRVRSRAIIAIVAAGTLAATFGGARAATPPADPQAATLVGKPDAASAGSINSANKDPSKIERSHVAWQAGKESMKPENKNFIIIGVSKGKMEEINPNTGKPLTAKDIGDILTNKLAKWAKKLNETPAQTKIEEGQSVANYTSIYYFFRGDMLHANGLDLEQAVALISSINGEYDVVRAEAAEQSRRDADKHLTVPSGPVGQD